VRQRRNQAQVKAYYPKRKRKMKDFNSSEEGEKKENDELSP